jgi:hypothetical protein
MSLYVFNQYYFDLLKKVRDISRNNRKSDACSVVRHAIKDNYSSYDKLSDEHIAYFTEVTQEICEGWSANVATIDDAKSWLELEETSKVEIYKGISIGTIDSVLKSRKTLYHYFTLMVMFSKGGLSEQEVSSILARLKSMATVTDFDEFEKSFDDIESDATKAHMKFLLLLKRNSKSVTDTTPVESGETSYVQETLQGLESTSLGKLAKEIMDDIDVSQLQKNISDDGNIFKAFADPEGGLCKILGTVSQKMISKLASGEIKQDTLLQDALQFSSTLNTMLPPGASGGLGGLGDLGGIMSQMGELSKMMGSFGDGGGGGDGNPFDMSKLSSLMSAFGGGGGGASKRSDTRTSFNTSEMSRVAKAKQMRRKLEKRKKNLQSRNVPTEPNGVSVDGTATNE